MHRARLMSCSLSMALVAAAGLAAVPANAPQSAATLTSDQLFQANKIWTIHLTLPNDTFSALTPTAPAPPAPPVGAAAPPAQSAQGAPAPSQAAPAPPRPPMQIPSVLPPDLLKQVVRGQFVGPEGGRNGLTAQRGVDFVYVHASVDIDGMKFADVGVRPKGNGSYIPILNGRIQKPSLKIDLHKYVKDQQLAGVTMINLNNEIFDATWMNEPLAYRLYREAGVPASRTSYARVYVTTKGGEPNRYLGLYDIIEEVDTRFTESRFHVAGGALYKPVTAVPFKFLGRDWADYNQMYDPKTSLTDADKQHMLDFCDLVSNAPDDQFSAKIGDFLDIDAFAKYMAALVWLANPDSILETGQNYYVHYNPATKKFAFIPWDQDHSFDQYVPWRTPESQQQLDIMHPWVSPFAGAPFAAQVENNLLARTFKLPAFKQRYLAALASITKTVTMPERIAKQMDDLAPLIAPLVPVEPKDVRIISFDEALAGKPYTRPFNQNVPIVPAKVFLPLRQASVVAQLKALGAQ